MEYFPEVVQAVAGDDFVVFAYFSDGTVRRLDAKPLIERGGAFSKLSDGAFFAERLTVMNGTVAWDVAGDRDESRCIDLDPFAVYEQAVVVSDPLVDAA